MCFVFYCAGYIVDARGTRVRLACVNWSGAAQKDGVVGGLQHQPAGAIADEVEQLVNAVLLPPDGSADSSALAEAGDVAVFVGVALHGPQHPRRP